ncbi:MAG: imidazolonepropionase, partial [Chloroflexi bacterium]|nr:imidazolonepropionase [Chloroflexota bacterium]
MKNVSLLLKNIDQLITCAGSEQALRGAEMQTIAPIQNGAVAIADGTIVAVGESAEICSQFSADEVVDCNGRSVIPGLVDPHTHTVFGGDRVHEFEMRIEGASYMEIMAAGGGIVSTMRHTRSASEAELVTSARQRLDEML